MSITRARALLLTGVLAVIAVVMVVVAVIRDSQAGAVSRGCPEGAVTVDLTLPAENQQVTVRVYNGSGLRGLAEKVTADFQNRHFRTGKPAENRRKLDDVALIRYGPEAVGKAWVLRAYFLNQAQVKYEPARKGAVVDVVVGEDFQQLATFTEVNQAMAGLGAPELPPGACLGAS